MEGQKVILYIHGMGGGADSRIPSILSECMPEGLRIVVRTYDFDPDKALEQIASWVDELHPMVLAGESLGANHALVMRSRYGLPAVLVSPALNAPAALRRLAPLTLLPGVSALLDRIYRPRPGERQLYNMEELPIATVAFLCPTTTRMPHLQTRENAPTCPTAASRGKFSLRE